ncbi:hypothetical protein NT01CX_1731 [Clostridium novyi NT]|uniref:Uncharacterized protein n=1 Tax=Clostridium novyi (strain NT) TaxID=386415 RepID=A0PZK8_CLONN|nr:hypothetical protein NT01CX_1731 [Clostridium novyi NT]
MPPLLKLTIDYIINLYNNKAVYYKNIPLRNLLLTTAAAAAKHWGTTT